MTNASASFFGYRIDGIALQDAEVLSASWWKGYDLPQGAGIPSGVSYAAPAGAGNLVLRDGSLDRILIPGGYVWLPEGTAPVYCYNVTDHLGSVRMVVDEVGTPLQVTPFGNELDPGQCMDWTIDQSLAFTLILGIATLQKRQSGSLLGLIIIIW